MAKRILYSVQEQLRQLRNVVAERQAWTDLLTVIQIQLKGDPNLDAYVDELSNNIDSKTIELEKKILMLRTQTGMFLGMVDQDEPARLFSGE